MNPVEQLITLRGIELETLHGAGPLAFEVYVMLRWWMDYRTGITGRRRPISLAMLITYWAPRKTSFPENPAYKNQRLTEPILQKSGVFRGARKSLTSIKNNSLPAGVSVRPPLSAGAARGSAPSF